MADGSKKKNVYRGEKNFDELQKAFAAIPEIAALIEEIKSEWKYHSGDQNNGETGILQEYRNEIQ